MDRARPKPKLLLQHVRRELTAALHGDPAYGNCLTHNAAAVENPAWGLVAHGGPTAPYPLEALADRAAPDPLDARVSSYVAAVSAPRNGLRRPPRREFRGRNDEVFYRTCQAYGRDPTLEPADAVRRVAREYAPSLPWQERETISRSVERYRADWTYYRTPEKQRERGLRSGTARAAAAAKIEEKAVAAYRRGRSADSALEAATGRGKRCLQIRAQRGGAIAERAADNAERNRRILDALASGASVKAAARAHGTTARTVRRIRAAAAAN